MTASLVWQKRVLGTRLTPTLEILICVMNLIISSGYPALKYHQTFLESGDLQGLLVKLSTFSGVREDRKCT